MNSLLVTGRGRRCYGDRSRWEPEWSELTKGIYGDRATLVKGSCSVVSACQSCNGNPGREQTVEKD
jgi:hypothetical protein